MDSGSVWLLMGHDGALLEYTACQSQGSGPGVWRGHLYKTLGKNFVPHVRPLVSVLPMYSGVENLALAHSPVYI